MRFEPTAIPGCVAVHPERFEDVRGHFARTWDADAFAKRGLNPTLAQCSASFNRKKGTLRGMHYQAPPHAEAKLVRCTRGALFDVCLDLRPGSPTFKRWVGVELSAENGRAVYLPEGCAHGFLTLEDDTEIFYMISVPWAPEAARGVRWDDPAFAIAWPDGVTTILPRDASYPDFVS